MTPGERMEAALAAATASPGERSVASAEERGRVEYVCRCPTNRAGVRLVMACLLAKLDRPGGDPRRPYTEIGTPDSFSGRAYDEQYITRFVSSHRLPCNPITAFLTPTLGNLNRPITPDFELIGAPLRLYVDAQPHCERPCRNAL